MGRGFDDVDLVFAIQAACDRQNMNVDNGNTVRPVCKDVPVHTTVCFSKELNVSYSVRSPVKLSNNKLRASNQLKSGSQSGCHAQSKSITDLNWNKDDNLTTSKQKLDNNASTLSAATQHRIKSNDGIFWSPSCAVLLAYHRWFNNFTENEGKIEIDLSKNLIHSTAGIRVIETRDESGLFYMPKEKRAAGFVVYRLRNNEREYLLLQASNREHHWTPPKGHVKHGESDMETALRETEEESGLKESDLEIYDFQKVLHYDVRGRPKTVIYWPALLKDAAATVKLSDEHQAFRWSPVDEACQVVDYPEMQELMRACDDFLSKRR